MIFEDGYIPDEVQAAIALENGTRSDRTKLLSLAKGFDDSGKIPPVLEWGQFYAYVQKASQPENLKWWEGFNASKFFTPSQGSMPNCAGFSLANASLIRTLLQIKNEYSEQVPQKFNPQGTWQASKNGSTRGGQTISAIADAGRNIGNCLAMDLGPYTDTQSFPELEERERINAARHQVGVSLYEGSRENVPEIIFNLCKKGFSIIVGNCIAVQDGRKADSNGVEVVQISRQKWAHATTFGGFQIVNNTEYVFWVNSHGNIYPASDGSPDFGGWMSFETVQQFARGQFFDLCAVVYAEADYSQNQAPTLNPWRI